MGVSDTIVRVVRERLGTSSREAMADGGTPSETVSPRSRRANAWAGVYAATFGQEERDDAQN